MSPKPKVTIDVLIPAYNEADALPELLAEIDRGLLRRILVVDNASTDGTGEVARQHGAEVAQCPTPGYGAACLAGMAYLRQDPPDILVFLDGDRSDHPRFMPSLVDPIVADEQDMVLGSRVLGTAEKGSLNGTQRFGNWLSTFLMRLCWGIRYTDLGPFRAIRWTQLEAIGMTDTNFGWTIEMQIRAHLAGLRTTEVPVDYRNRIGVSKISGTISGCFKAGTKILYTIFKYRMGGGLGSRASEEQQVTK